MGRPRKKELFPLDSQDPLRGLLAALDPKKGVVTVSQQQRQECEWNEERWQALVHMGLVEPCAPAKKADCFECDEQCRGLTVHAWGPGRCFLICPYHSQVGEMPINPDLLRSHRFTLAALQQWLIALLACRPLHLPSGESVAVENNQWLLGIHLVGKIRLLCYLGFHPAKGWYLQTEKYPFWLRDSLRFDGQGYVLDAEDRETLLSSDTSTEPPKARAARLLAEVNYRKVHKEKYSGSIYDQLAQEEGISKGQVESLLKDARKNRAIQELSRKYEADLRRSKNKTSDVDI